MSIGGKSVLVTGGFGYLGSHLVDALVTGGANVTAIQRSVGEYEAALPEAFRKIDKLSLDLRSNAIDEYLFRRIPDVVFHLAGHANSPASIDDPKRDFEDNLVGTFNLLDAVRRRAPAVRFVNASTAAVYGEGSGERFTEASATRPVSPYGLSKLTAERYAALFADVYGMRTASLRLFPAYGPRIRRWVVYDFLERLHLDPEKLTIEGDGRQVRDFIFVGDVVAAMLLVAEKAPMRGEVYNVASGNAVTILELAQLLCDAYGARAELAFDGETRAGKAKDWRADISRLVSIGFRPRVELREGLAKTVAWYRAERVQRHGITIA